MTKTSFCGWMTTRTSEVATSFHQCVREGVARRAGAARVRGARATSHGPDVSHEVAVMYYSKHTYVSRHGPIKIMTTREHRKLKNLDCEFCFFVSASSEKAARQLSSDWDALCGYPVESMLRRFEATVFRKELPATPPIRTVDVEAEIELSDTTPVVRKQFRLSEEQKQAVREWTQEMLAAHMIRQSKSAFSSPTFCIKKAVGWRIVHDFRALNTRVRVPATPVPRKEDIYDAMAKGRIFSALDPLWGIFHVRLREQDIPFTAFSTPDGLYGYLVTPMGLSSSPSAFNRLMQSVFFDQREFCRAYFDDLFMFTPSDSMEEHLVALEAVLKRCEDQQLYVKLSKSAPLTEATKGRTPQERISLDDEQRRCFELLKSRLSSPPVLAHPDSSRAFHVKMDASDYAVGGYLYQLDDEDHEQIFAYGGRKLSSAERIYPTREKELLAALHAMRLWKSYLIDKPFFVNSDHRTLESILVQTTCSQRLARWLNELSFYQPQFRWIPGDTNVVTDAISRSPSYESTDTAAHVSLASLLDQLSSQQRHVTAEDAYQYYARQRPSVFDQCRKLYGDGQHFGSLIAHLSGTDSPEPAPVDLHPSLRANVSHFFVDDRLLYYQPDPDAPPRLCIPEDADLRDMVLFECHDTAARGRSSCVPNQS